MRGNLLFIGLLLFSLTLSACSPANAPTPVGFRTDGSAKERTCTGIGIEKCDYVAVEIPEFIDLSESTWASLRSERKSADKTMCYLDLPGGVISERLLMFDCEPVYEESPEADPRRPPQLRAALKESYANMAEAAAMFRVCAGNTQNAEESAAWLDQSNAIETSAERIGNHLDASDLHSAFEARIGELIESPRFRSETLDYMDNCDADSLRDASAYVRESAEIETFYLSQ